MKLFSCIRPHPKFEWWKDGEKITTSDPTSSTVKNIHFEGKGINLVMDPVDSTDNGHYKCVASNSEGKVETEGTMIVHCKFSEIMVSSHQYHFSWKHRSPTCPHLFSLASFLCIVVANWPVWNSFDTMGGGRFFWFCCPEISCIVLNFTDMLITSCLFLSHSQAEVPEATGSEEFYSCWWTDQFWVCSGRVSST